MANLEIKDSVAGWGRTTTSMIRTWWTTHGTTVLRLACVIMAIFAALKLGDEFRRLLFESGRNGAIDLKLYHQMVRDWFSGRPLYQLRHYATYPPASYLLLWPFHGWLAVTPARWLWAVTSVAALGWLVHLIIQESGAETRPERVFVALMALSMNAAGVTIGSGQLIVHLLPILLFGLLLLRQDGREWHKVLLAASLFLVALVKPSISAPFFWIMLFVGGALQTAFLIAFGYVGLTLFAATFQESGVLGLLGGWLERSTAVAATRGYSNLHIWLGTLGLGEWILPASLLVVAALGLWVYQHRKGDFWLLLGVTALVARLWTYHQVYDDVLVLLPMIALFRIAKREASPQGAGVAAGLLLAATILSMLAPARLEHFPPPWSLMFKGGHTLVWVAVLGFLLDRARRDRNAEV